MTTPKGMGKIVITFRLGRFCRTKGKNAGTQAGIDSRYVFFLCDVWQETLQTLVHKQLHRIQSFIRSFLQRSKQLPDPTCSVSYERQLAIGSHLSPDKSNLQLHIKYFKIQFNIILTFSPSHFTVQFCTMLLSHSLLAFYTSWPLHPPWHRISSWNKDS